MEIGTPATGKVTWTGLPKIERTHWAALRVQKGRWWVKDLDDQVESFTCNLGGEERLEAALELRELLADLVC